MPDPLSSNGPQTTESTVNDQIQPNAQPAVQPTAQPQPQTQAQAAQPTNGQPTNGQPKPQIDYNQHKGLFDKVLYAMNGSPTITDPATGETRQAPMTKASMTKSILAGAITSILHGAIAGGQASANAPAGPTGTNTPGNFAAMGAGAQVGSAEFNKMKQGPQQQIDQQMIRKAAAIKNTTDELRNQMMTDKLHGDDWSRKEDYYTKTKDVWQPVMDTLEASDKDLAVDSGNPRLLDPSLQKMGHDDVYAFFQKPGNVGKYSPVQDGWTTETHTDGRTYHVPTYSLVTNGPVNVNRDTLLALSPFNSGVKDVLERNNTPTVQLPSTMLISFEKSAQAAHGAYEFINQIQTGLGVTDKLSQSAFNEKFRTNPALQRQVASLADTLGNVATQSTAHALAQLQASGKSGEIFKLIGKSPDEISDFVNDKQNEEKKATADAVADAKKKDADKPADSARIQNVPALINSSTPYLNKEQRAGYISKLHPGMSNAELDKVQKEASDENDRGFTHSMEQQRLSQEKAAKGDAAIAKGQKPVVGVDANGNQVLVPAGDVKKYGLSQVREVGQAENEKVTNARSLLTVFNNNDLDDLGIMQLATKLDKEGKLGPAASRFQDWLNKSGSVPTSLAGFDAGDPDVQRLFTKLGLSTTGLMQVHVGARGSAQMLEHFEDLAKAKGMSPNAFKAAIDTENSYVKMKAMLPNTGKAQAQQPNQSAAFTQYSSDGKWGWDGKQWVARKAQ